MKRINPLFYCSFFDNRKQQVILDADGLRECRLLCSDDFAAFIHCGVTVSILAVFHDPNNTLFDDKEVSYRNALSIARGNARVLLSTFSL